MDQKILLVTRAAPWNQPQEDLSPEGEHQAFLCGLRLYEAGYRPKRVVTSTRWRDINTARFLQQGLGSSGSVNTHRSWELFTRDLELDLGRPLHELTFSDLQGLSETQRRVLIVAVDFFLRDALTRALPNGTTLMVAPPLLPEIGGHMVRARHNPPDPCTIPNAHLLSSTSVDAFTFHGMQMISHERVVDFFA